MERDALSQPMAAAVNASLFDREAEQGKGRLPRRPSRNKQEDVCPPLPPECSFKPRIIDYEKVCVPVVGGRLAAPALSRPGRWPNTRLSFDVVALTTPR